MGVTEEQVNKGQDISTAECSAEIWEPCNHLYPHEHTSSHLCVLVPAVTYPGYLSCAGNGLGRGEQERADGGGFSSPLPPNNPCPELVTQNTQNRILFPDSTGWLGHSCAASPRALTQVQGWVTATSQAASASMASCCSAQHRLPSRTPQVASQGQESRSREPLTAETRQLHNSTPRCSVGQSKSKVSPV